MTKKEFHSFIKLVIKMYNTQQDSYKKYNGDSNLVAQARALEKKVSDKLCDFKPNQEVFYEWQPLFMQIVKYVRAEQAMYYATKHDKVLARCKEYEARLGNGIVHINRHSPEVFEEEAKQEELFKN